MKGMERIWYAMVCYDLCQLTVCLSLCLYFLFCLYLSIFSVILYFQSMIVMSVLMSFLHVRIFCLSVFSVSLLFKNEKDFLVLLVWIELDLEECSTLLNYFTGRLKLHSPVIKTSYLTLINHVFNPNFVINLGLVSNKIQARNIFNNKSRSVIRKINNIEYNI